MYFMDLLTLILVGLVAGLLASFLVGGIGFGILGDIVVGIAGAFVGTWLFGVLNIRAPFTGLTSVIFVAFIGATLLLLVLGAASRGRRRRA
jgi:uncharacterized membrane protein YeaQ/YmgE (transglycosylase-associated protein family)